MRGVEIALALVLLIAAARAGWAAETKLVVRVRSKDAKFVGTSMGGASVAVRDADTGALLASGVTSGDTGDSKRIVVEPHVRGARLADESTARFEARIALVEPRLVTVEVAAPLGQRQSLARASVQLWLIPGRHVEGDGLVVEIPGFAVDVLAPRANESVSRAGGAARVPLRANVVML